MDYHVKRMSLFIKFKRMEIGISQRDFAKSIFVSRSLIDNIENGKLTSLNHHIDNIFECFGLDKSQYIDDDYDFIKRFYTVIHRVIYYDLDKNPQDIIDEFYFKGIENTYLYIYYQLLKTCLYSREYLNDEFLFKYIPLFENIIDQFDLLIQQFFQITKYIYYKEKGMFNKCVLNDKNVNFDMMNNDMKSYYYQAYALRYMYEGDFYKQFKYFNLANEYCLKMNNQKRLIALKIIECDIYEKLGDMNKVIDILYSNIKKIDEINFTSMKYVFISNLGIEYFKIKNYAYAIQCLKVSFLKNNDNLDLFYLILSHMLLDNKNEVKRLLNYQYQVECFNEIYYELIEWCSKAYQRPYTKKCQYILERIYKRYFASSSYDAKKLILNLLIDNYEHHEDYQRVNNYQKELIKLLESRINCEK